MTELRNSGARLPGLEPGWDGIPGLSYLFYMSSPMRSCENGRRSPIVIAQFLSQEGKKVHAWNFLLVPGSSVIIRKERCRSSLSLASRGLSLPISKEQIFRVIVRKE